MKILALIGAALSTMTAGALLGGCGGSPPPIGAPGAMEVDGSLANPGTSRAWMAPGAKGRDLLYVSHESVDVYSYPHGSRLGSLGITGTYLCSDKFGNIFIPSSPEVFVYAHGASTPKTILYDYNETAGCSVDPSSEDLAVAGAFTGGLTIFPYNPERGWRFSRGYRDPTVFEYSFCAYDDQGNLFVDGASVSGAFILAELPKAGKTFTTITLNQSISAPGSVQWDGGYLAVEDFGHGYPDQAVIYRFAINGSTGTEVSTTHLTHSYGGAQFWIQGGSVIGPMRHGSRAKVGLWKFPAGGSFVKSFSSKGSPSGETVSLK